MSLPIPAAMLLPEHEPLYLRYCIRPSQIEEDYERIARITNSLILASMKRRRWDKIRALSFEMNLMDPNSKEYEKYGKEIDIIRRIIVVINKRIEEVEREEEEGKR